MQNGPWLRSTAIGLVLVAATLVPDRNSFSSAQQVETNQYDALGRLIVTQTTGGQNNGEARSICYDEVGNREKFRASTDASTATCVPPPPAPTPTPSPTPTPTPTPTPSNSPPNAVDNSVSGTCNGWTTINVLLNDTDPEPNYPFSLVSLSAGTGGDSSASIFSSTHIEVFFGPTQGTNTMFTYTMQDSLGATDTATLTVSTGSCSGGPPPE